MSNKKTTPSLLEPESRGGDTAEGGFAFQEGVLLSKIPLWIAQEGFTMLIREAIGDTEAKFYVPGHGFQIELVEAKNYYLAPSEFWEEVKRFREIDAGSPGTYRWFTLASAGLSEKLKPLVNSLRRVRDPYIFYNHGSAVGNNSFEDYVNVVKELGHTEEEARFLFEKVLIEADYSLAKDHGEALFRQAMTDHLPEYNDVPGRILCDIFISLASLVRSRMNQPILRSELYETIRKKIEVKYLPPERPVIIHTAIKNGENPGNCIYFDWAEFFGGESRSFPATEVWNRKLLGELKETKNWIIKSRSTRRVKLTGNRRLSTAIAIGSVFSAVSGFVVDMEYRGKIWSTDAHPSHDTPTYNLTCRFQEKTGEHLVVTIGILRDISSEIETCLARIGLSEMPTLHLRGDQPILSPDQANAIVRKIKDAISKTLIRSKAKCIDLFYAGPSHLALFIGHRLNATAPVQCYERVSNEHYIATCRLPTS